ncbi:hypothetical protein AAT19DRAFT_12519 [Rhodotorula toruloides]|uniref:Zn(2)-C6 fungal-type domain-containing protein n=1 Tax=Rhodotorula toruloides TaxID=5286 RepID=A0A2T0AGG1_RHOTO|nr:hypothetical protein AAT19DRAFT_12519 [Rhodotorula toruloides]
MRQKASVEVAPAQLDSMKVCKPCHARKVLCDLARPVCSACLRYSKDRPSHRCEYGPNAALPGEAKSLRPDRSLDVDETFQPLPRTRSAARALLGTASSRPAQPPVARPKEDGGTGGGSGGGPAVDATSSNETSLTAVHDNFPSPSPSRSVPASLAYASGTASRGESGGAVLAGQTGEATPESNALSGTPHAMAPTSRLLFTDPDQPTVATHLPLASLTPNQQLLPHPPTPAPFISIFQPEAPESALISMISSRPRARTEVSAGTQRYPDDSHLCSSTFADIAFSHEFVSPRRMQQSQHTLLSFAPPRPPSGGNLNAVLASGASSSFDTAYAYD